MEPYWNNVRLEQVKGRAIRICSHQDLPYANRIVDIYTYCSVFSSAQKKNLDMTVEQYDKGKTSDEFVYELSVKKDTINNQFLKIMKESAVDCALNRNDNKNIACMDIQDGKMNTYSFDPNLAIDIETTQVKNEPTQKRLKDTAPSKFQDEVLEIEIGSKIYQISLQKGSGDTVYDIYPNDNRPDYSILILQGKIKPIGILELNVMYADTEARFRKPIIRFF